MAYKVTDKEGRPIQTKDGQNILGFDNHSEVELKDFSDKERSFLAVANAESPDRFKDVINVKGWKLENYRKNPVVMAFHNYGSLPVGRSLEEFASSKKGVKRLMFRPQFAAYPDSLRMYEMYRDKYLKGFSVGFIPMKEEPIKQSDKDKEESPFFHNPTRYLEQELLENSVAPVPAHPDALSEIRTMVQKGQIYIPARYLGEEQGLEVSETDQYIHAKLEDEDKFVDLFVEELGEGITRVFGHQKEQDEKELFFHKIIFSKEFHTLENAKGLVEGLKEQTFPSEEDYKEFQYNPEKYSAKEPVLVGDIIILEEEAFETGRKDIDLDLEEEDETKAKEKYKCECIDCGHKLTTDKHCKDIECPECGGTMRREERPGAGEESQKDEEKDLIGVWLEVGKDIEFEEDEYIEKEFVEKPYPNEHACRLEDPGDFDKFARKNCFRKSDGKCIDYIFGIKGGKSKTQALRYKKDVWTKDVETASAAKANCAGHDGMFEAAGGKLLEFFQEGIISEEEVAEWFEKHRTLLKETSEKNLIEKIKEILTEMTEDIVERLKKTVKAVIRKEKGREETEETREIDLEEIELEEMQEEEMMITDEEGGEITTNDLRKIISDSVKTNLGELPD